MLFTVKGGEIESVWGWEEITVQACNEWKLIAGEGERERDEGEEIEGKREDRRGKQIEVTESEQSKREDDGKMREEGEDGKKMQTSTTWRTTD